MAGLIDSLESLFSSSGIQSLISGCSGNLGKITSNVTSLINGPTELTDLISATGSLPVPPALGGIASLGGSLNSFSLPSDLSSPLNPILGPITNLTATIGGGAMGSAGAVIEIIRQIIKITTGRTFGGPQGMPDSIMSHAGMPDMDALRVRLAEARASIEEFGPHLDAQKIFDLLLRGSKSFQRLLLFVPDIPIAGEVMEELGTLAAWRAMSPQELTEDIVATLRLSRDALDMPRTRIATPVLDSVRSLRDVAAFVDAQNASVIRAFAGARRKVLEGNGKASIPDTVLLEQTAAMLKRCADSLDSSSPLGRHQDIPEELTRTLLSAMRGFESGFSTAPLAEFIREKTGLIPQAPDNPFADVLQSINDFNLSSLTSGLQTVTDAVQEAVNTVNEARETVRDALENLLSPLADGLDSALNAAGFEQIQQALAGLPGQVNTFVNTKIQPNLESVRNAIDGAVQTVSDVVESFDPASLVKPIRDAIENVAAMLQTDSVRSIIEQLDQSLQTAITALESLDLSAAGDKSIDGISGIEEKVRAIDPSTIPDAAKPIIRQAVTVVTDIDFTGDVAAPIIDKGVNALADGVGSVLSALEEGVEQLRTKLNEFRPSQLIGAALDKPFEDLTSALKQFKPSDLLNRLQEALDEMASKLQVLDVGAVVDPLIEAHNKVRGCLDKLKPSELLKPVNDALKAAIDRLYDITGIDTIFDGVNDILEFIQSFTALLGDIRDLCAACGALFENPGIAETAVEALIDEVLAKFSSAQWTPIAAALQECSAAATANTRDQIASLVANSLEEASHLGRQLLESAALRSIITAAHEFPQDRLKAFPPAPVRKRLIDAAEQILAESTRIEAARTPWGQLGPALENHAPAIQEELLDYYNLIQSQDGGAFREFMNPPGDAAALAQSVREALQEGVQELVQSLLAAFSAASPYLKSFGTGLSTIIGAIHDKVDSITGDESIGGTVNAIEEAVNILRTVDLSIIAGPLDTLYQRFQTAVNALDPAPLKQALEAARDSIAGLLNVSTLINPSTISTLDNTYNEAVNKIDALAPSKIITQTLDPVYKDLLEDILPILDLPSKLRQLVETAGRSLGTEIETELGRVEQAFDQMLRAIPLALGEGSGASASASASVSVG
jgi:hypothetical protein